MVNLNQYLEWWPLYPPHPTAVHTSMDIEFKNFNEASACLDFWHYFRGNTHNDQGSTQRWIEHLGYLMTSSNRTETIIEPWIMTTLLDDFGFRLWGNMAQHIVSGQEELLILYYTCICIYTVYCIPYTVIQSYTVTVFRIPYSELSLY